jgi:hypothetical protein
MVAFKRRAIYKCSFAARDVLDKSALYRSISYLSPGEGALQAARKEEFCEDTSLLSDRLSEARTKFVGGLNITSLLSDHLGEARTKFVGGLNITSRSSKGRPPSALLLVGDW